MKKNLKICLAMGGGVALGVFSGSSLTEALKLLLLFGQDKKGKPYDDIIVDGMSGASAGAVALTIMLRSLMDYKSMMKIYNLKKGNDESTISDDSLLQEIANDYFNGDLNKIPEHKQFKLVALQVAQKIQHQIWVKRLDAKNLFGSKLNPKNKTNIHGSFGLLDRGHMERLAKDYLIVNESFDIDNKLVLDQKRVIFACSITNLLPIEINNGNGKKLTKLQKNVLKSTGSSNHTELRVIDFIFDKNSVDPTNQSDTRWFKFYQGAKNETMDLDIKQSKAWSVLIASALACGAFPIAFEPVLLKRYKEEYGDNNWPKQFKAIQKEIGDQKITRKSFFNENDNAYIDYNSFNFPYIDGGTFNNEPIREAFRIASFQDFEQNNNDFDRLVLFVDPAVRSESHRSFNVSSFSPVTQKNFKNQANGEHNKLIANVTDIISVLQRQGSIKEEHRIKDVKESLDLRKDLYSYINNNDKIYEKLTYSLVQTAFKKIQTNLKQGMISVGTRDVIRYFENELKKNCLEATVKCKLINLDRPVLEDMKQIIESKIGGQLIDAPDQIYALLNNGITDEIEKECRKAIFAKTIFKMMSDFSLRTVGKNENAENMSILPIAPNSLQTIELPGDEVAAFSGFASLKSRIYSFEYGKLSTLLSLNEREEGYRHKDEHPIINIPNFEAVKSGFIDTLKNHDFYNPKYKFANEIKTNLFQHGVKRISNLLFSIFKFHFNLFELLKGIKNSVFTLVIGVVSTLIASLKFYKLIKMVLAKLLNNKASNAAKDISYKTLIPITISILSKDKTSKPIKVLSNDEGKKKIKMYRHDVKDENGDIKYYQYLFQLYYLEYMKSGYLEENESDFASKSKNKSEPTAFNKTDPEDVGAIGLSFIGKIPNPSIDNNINYLDWRKELEKESQKIEIKDITWKSQSLGNIVEDINKRSFSLYYSLKNLNYHVNPMLEYNIDKPNNTWYFKENTKAFYLELMDKK